MQITVTDGVTFREFVFTNLVTTSTFTTNHKSQNYTSAPLYGCAILNANG
jgi:hypothetical protein